MPDSLKIWGTDYTGVVGFKAKDSSNNQYAYLRPQGNKAITENGSNIDVAGYATVSVSVSGGGTPAISVVDTPDSHGGTVRTITALDISDSTLTTADQLAQGITAYNKLGVKLTGTGGGGGSLTEHDIYLEFTDSTDETIEVYYDDPWIGSLITSTEPTTYGLKTIDSASLDNVVWYQRPSESWETLLPEGAVHVNPGNPYGGMWISDLGDVAITLGSVWRVTFDNVAYIVEGTGNGPYNTPVIGNPLFSGGTDDGSDVPFCFEQNPWGAWTGWTAPSVTQDVDHNIKVERQITT